MRPGRLVPPVELEIPTQPHSTGCPPSTTATNKRGQNSNFSFAKLEPRTVRLFHLRERNVAINAPNAGFCTMAVEWDKKYFCSPGIDDWN
jgi:hypothetical protein